MEVTYRMQDGFLLPNLLMPQERSVHLGKYAELRRQYLMKHRRVLYTNLKTSCRLTEHLAEIEQSAQKMVEQTVAQMAQNEGVTDAGSDTLPAFLDTHLIEAILLDDGGRKHKRQDIFNYFQAHQNLAERTEFLKNC